MENYKHIYKISMTEKTKQNKTKQKQANKQQQQN